MQTSDFERFRAVMVGMGKVYEREIDAPLLDAYWLALRAWNLSDFEAAAAHLMQTSEFMPRPAAFTQLRKAGELTAGEAWDRVMSGPRPEPGSRADRAAQICGGYYHITHANLERDVPHIQRRFFEVYRELADVDETREAVPQITAPHRSTLRIRTGGLKRLGDVVPRLEDIDA